MWFSTWTRGGWGEILSELWMLPKKKHWWWQFRQWQWPSNKQSSKDCLVCCFIWIKSIGPVCAQKTTQSINSWSLEMESNSSPKKKRKEWSVPWTEWLLRTFWDAIIGYVYFRDWNNSCYENPNVNWVQLTTIRHHDMTSCKWTHKRKSVILMKSVEHLFTSHLVPTDPWTHGKPRDIHLKAIQSSANHPGIAVWHWWKPCTTALGSDHDSWSSSLGQNINKRYRNIPSNKDSKYPKKENLVFIIRLKRLRHFLENCQECKELR